MRAANEGTAGENSFRRAKTWFIVPIGPGLALIRPRFQSHLGNVGLTTINSDYRSMHSLPKRQLSQDELKQILSTTREIVSSNKNEAERLNNEYMYRLDPDRQINFDITGAPTACKLESLGLSKNFFEQYNRFFVRTNGTVSLRGPDYLIALDSNFPTSKKYAVLERDFWDSISFLQSNFDNISPIEQLCIIDYAKNSAVTIFNSFVEWEKTFSRNSHKPDDEYLSKRIQLQYVLQDIVSIYYMIFFSKDTASILEKLNNIDEKIVRLVTSELISDAYNHRISARAINRGESTHPLIISGLLSLLLKRHSSGFHHVVGLPSGSTELAAAAAWFLSPHRKSQSHLILVPISMHSIKSHLQSNIDDYKLLFDIACNPPAHKAARKVLLIDDNSSTGQTIDIAQTVIEEKFDHPILTVAISEADVIRSEMDRESTNRTRVAHPTLFQYSVGILPVSKTVMKKHDFKEYIERRNLRNMYLKRVNNAENQIDSICNEIYAFNSFFLPQRELEQRKTSEMVLRFAGTFLSNFAYCEIIYKDKNYRSVERAYQRAKFDFEDLNSVSEQVKNESMQYMISRGIILDVLDLNEIFEGVVGSSSEAKSVAEILVKHGYQRNNWAQIRVPIMVEFLVQKFKDHSYMEKLLGTGDKFLIEGNNWDDTFWGYSGNRGQNMLGSALMVIRKRIREGTLV